MTSKHRATLLPIAVVALAACGTTDLSSTPSSSAEQAIHRQHDHHHRMAGGIYRTCVVDDGGTVSCMGAGPLGNGGGSSSSSSTPVKVEALTEVVDIAASTMNDLNTNGMLALESDGTVWQWAGTIGNTPHQVSGLPLPAVSVSGAQCKAHGTGCVVLVDGSVWSLGAVNAAPSPIESLTNIVSLSRDGSSVCALTAAGNVKCWGPNVWGEVGNGNTNPVTTPRPVDVSGIVELDGVRTECAVDSGGVVKCWGANIFGEAGVAPNGPVLAPSTVSGMGGKAVDVGVAWHNTCALRVDGVVRCWGRGDQGGLGDGTHSNSSSPVTVAGSHTATAIEGGVFTNCEVITGMYACWGGDGTGELGVGSIMNDSPTPLVMQGGVQGGVLRVSSGASHTCAIEEQLGEVKCVGDNSFGQLGNGTTTSSLTPVDTGMPDATDISSYGNSTCAVRMDGKVFCWGCPIKNTTTACSAANAITSPTPVGNFSDAIQVKVGGTYACVLRGTGDVQCFGADNNSKGLLGDGTANGSDAPVFVHNLDNAIALSVSSDHACAVRAGGFVQCWGDNAFGQLGNGGSGHAATPVTAMAGSPWAVAVATGTGTSMAVTSDGSLFFWGNGNNGDGNGAPTTHRTPNQVSGVLEAVDVAAGDDAQCYLNAHGHVKCWGLNTFGERGDNTIGGPTTYLPNLVVNSAGDEVSDMVSLSGSSETFCGASGLGHIACWGHSNHGQAGNGTTSDQPSGIVAAGF